MITLRLILLILAVVMFTLAVFNVQCPPNTPRVNFTAAGLLFWVSATIAG